MRRRSFLLSGLGLGGALLVGWGLMPPRSRLGASALMPASGQEVALNGWIKIAPDGRLMLAMPRSEMGQGVHTALAMLAADELDVPLAQVVLVEPHPDAIYGNVAMFVGTLPFHPADGEPGRETALVRSGRWITSKAARELGVSVTGGSSSVADAWEPLRLAAATARGQLLGAASLQWRVPVAELAVSDGVVSHVGGQRAHYGELAKAAAATPPGSLSPKDPKDWKLIGRPAPRLDVPAKSRGQAGFGIDVRQPGQLYAAVRHCPMIGGGVGALDLDSVRGLPGVERVVRLGSHAGSTEAVAVVARTSWHARQAAQRLQAQWTQRPAGALDSARILQALEAQAREAAAQDTGFAFHSSGDAAKAMQSDGVRKIEALYRAPYLAHATMEPMNCTAQVRDDGRVEVWVPTQAPTQARALAARVAGVPVEQVTLHVTYLGGGFGRRLEIDTVAQAVRVAMETGGRPVQLLWSREEDMGHDFYRPAQAALLQAALDRDGQPLALAIHSAGDAISPRWLERTLPLLAGPVDLPDKTASEGLFDLPYGIANQRMAHMATHSGVPVGFWRSVGHSHNAFFSESFIDELAHATGQDPYAFRLALLKDAPRHAAVLKLAAEKANWGGPLPAGHARGIALHESFDTIVAQVAEVSLEQGRPRVHRVVGAVDCGVVVNPGIVAQQMEGSVIFGLSAALYQRIDIEGGVVKQQSFPDYPLLMLKDAPVIETHIVPSTRAPGGMGEPGVPPVAPAVANALFALTGKRVREMPFGDAFA
jgi:isoquinoline 1-oxidoreductase beta subunit